MREFVIDVVKRFFADLKRNRVDTHAACTAFFLFVGLVPSLLILLTLIPFTPLSPQNLNSFIEYLLPSNLSSFALGITNELTVRSPAVLSVSTIVAIWSATKGTMCLSKGMEDIFGEKKEENFILYRAKCMVCTVFIGLVIVGIMIAVVFGEKVVGFFGDQLPDIVVLMNFFVEAKIIVFPLLFVLAFFLYSVIPGRCLSVRTRMPGSIMTALVLGIGLYVFSWYTSTFATKSIYGSMASIVFLLLLIYYAVYVFLIGAELNLWCRTFLIERHEKKVEKKTEKKAQKKELKIQKKAEKKEKHCSSGDGASDCCTLEDNACDS